MNKRKVLSKTQKTMSEETKKMWDLVKSKLTVDGLRDVARYYPELREEIRLIINARENPAEDE